MSEHREVVRRIERCTLPNCYNEAEGPCAACGRLLCYVHAFPMTKHYYCYQCHDKIMHLMIVQQEEGRG